MMFKSTILFASALLVKSISSQCLGNPLLGTGLAGPFGPALGPTVAPIAPPVASNGGGFTVTSASPIAPTGLSILSENLSIDGGLAVGGQLPFLSTVALAGEFPTVGAGAVSYGCGDGAIGILSEAPLGTLGPVGGPGVYRPGCGSVWY